MKKKKQIKKKIGIIGGVGPQATSVLYEKIIRASQDKYGAKDNDDYPDILIESVPIPDFISNKNAVPTAFNMLVKVVGDFDKIGVTRLCIASNTVHLLRPNLEKVTDIPFLSMIEAVGDKIQQLGFKKVGIVGSSVTVGSDLYKNVLSERKIEPLVPDEGSRKVIDKIIRYVLAGEDNGRERDEYIEILNKLIDSGAEGIILACTELPLAINYEALGGKIINSMQVLADALVDYYYQEQ